MDANVTLAASRRGLAAGILCLPLLGWSQTPAPAPVSAETQAWRAANEAVGQFPRGHVDVLKWEQAHPTVEPAAIVRGQALALTGLEDGVRLAWKAHADLGPVLARLDGATQSALASGRWDRIAPQWIRRLDGMRELLAVTAQVRKDWASAQTARLLEQQAAEMLESAQSARALGDRMVSVGNWSKIQQAPWKITEADARINLQRAHVTSVQANNRLLKDVRQTDLYHTVDIPLQADDLPKQILDEAQVQTRAAATQEQLTYAEGFKNRDNAFQAYEAYLGAFAIASASAEVLQLRTFVADETVLHYNGMLKSTWDVLTEAHNRMQAMNAAASARRDFEIARIDLEWVLLGGEPEAFVGLGAVDAAPVAAGQ